MKISRFALKLRPDILLHPNIPRPLHGVAPRIVLGQAWWDNERLKAYQSTQNHCIACGISAQDAKEKQQLEAHECYKIDYAKGILLYVEAVPLCHFCHQYIHSGRLELLLESDQITYKLYKAIIKHGNKILKKNHLKRPAPPKIIAPWNKWRLQIGDKFYKNEKSTNHG